MRSLTAHFGTAQRAFLLAAVAGEYLIEVANAIVITVFINGWK